MSKNRRLLIAHQVPNTVLMLHLIYSSHQLDEVCTVMLLVMQRSDR